MQFRLNTIPILLALVVTSFALGACQPAPPPASINDIPIYPGAVELPTSAQAADNASLQEWLKRDAADRNTAKESIAYKHFRLPKDSTSSGLMSFYSAALNKAGWNSRFGAVPARQAFTRGSQYLVLYVFANTTTGDTELLMTLDR